MLPQNISDLLLEKFKIKNADSSKQKDFINSFEDLIQQSLTNFFMDNLSDEDYETFSKMQEKDETDAKAMIFANQKIPDLEKKVIDLVNEEIKKINY